MIKISACVIVKNEEKNIGRWLENVRPLADEIIVVDTGSTDATVKIAEAAGARTFFFAWCDDFAAAKNFALDQAKGQWIIFLDADEYFSPQSVAAVRPLLQRYEPNRRIVGVVCKLINIDQDEDNRFCGAICQVRLFRNLSKVRYEGRIHERLTNISGKGRVLQFASELVIYHTGYSSKIVDKKLKRNLAILQAEIERRGEEEEDAIYLADCYMGLGQYERAAEYARKAIATGLRFIGMEGHAEAQLASALMKLGKPTEEILAVLMAAMERYPQAAEFPMIAGLAYWNVKDFYRAEQSFRAGVALKDVRPMSADGEQALTMSDNAARLLPYAYMYLGKLAEMHFQAGQAFDFYWQGLALYPYEPTIFACCYRAIATQAPADIIALLNRLYDKKADAKWLAEHLAPFSAGQVYLYYARLAGMTEAQNIEAYLAAGRYDAAVVQLGDELESLYRLGIVSADALKLPREKTTLQVLLPKEYQIAWEQLAEGKPVPDAADERNLGRVLQRMKQGLFSAAAQDRPMERPLVSVLIPTYNRPELLEITLKSALAQTYENFEVIVCDNSTDDRTEQRIEKYRADSRLRYVRNRQAKTKAENFQPFEQLARGEFLQWLMDDDVLVETKLERMVRVFETNPQVTLVTSQRGFIDGRGRVQPSPYQAIPIEGEFGIFSGNEIGRAVLLLAMNFLGEPSAVLFRRRDLTHHYWRAESRGYETISDVAMWLELLEKGDCAIFREPLSYYRRHVGQEGQQSAVILLSRIEWYRLMKSYYEKGLFLTREEDFRVAVTRLYEEYEENEAAPHREAAPVMWARYVAAMEEIGQMLYGKRGKA